MGEEIEKLDDDLNCEKKDILENGVSKEEVKN